jgi:predicted nucleic acid-binding protein
MVLVDSNVLLDWLTMDPVWFAWSSQALLEAQAREGVAINPLIYAEVSIAFPTTSDADQALPPNRFLRLPLSYQVAFVAGKAFLAYRRRGGNKRSPLPDFFIGAHAEVGRMPLLTRDTRLTSQPSG